jgi:hypothetical protein
MHLSTARQLLVLLPGLPLIALSLRICYPLGSGKKYRLAFSANLEKFSPRGQEWVLDTMQCLQCALVPEAEGAPQAAHIATCAELEDYALSMHPACHIDNGFCELPVSDWGELVRIVGLKIALGSWEVIKTAAEVGMGCGELYLVSILALRDFDSMVAHDSSSVVKTTAMWIYCVAFFSLH